MRLSHTSTMQEAPNCASNMKNDNTNGGNDDGFKTQKRKIVEVEEEEEVGGLRWRSGGGATHHELRWGMGMSPDSRIVRVSRSSGGKDRHSKVLTAKGLRDRRVRLSVSTAIQFYDLQDRLGFDQPSKAVEWLIKAAAPAIDDLPQLGTFSNALDTDQCPAIVFTGNPSALGISSANTSQSSRDGHQGHCEILKMMMMKQQAESGLGKSSTSTNSNSGGEEGTGDTSLSRSECRVKARARARERERERERAKTNFQSCANPPATYCPVQKQQGDNDGAGSRDTFTGLLNSVADVESNHNSKYDSGRCTCAGLSVQQPYDHLFHDPSHPTSVMPQQFCPAFVNAAIFTAKSTCQDHKHHTDHLPSHFTSNPSLLLLQHQQQQQQQHNKSSFCVEEQQLVPINFSVPALSGRETLQSNSYNNIMAYYNHSVDQSSMFAATRNTYRQGIFDGRLFQWPNPDFDAVQGSLKENKKIHQNHHS